MKEMGSPQKSVNRESHYARTVRGTVHPLNDLNKPVLVVSHNELFDKIGRNAKMLAGAERVDWVISSFLNE